MFENLSNNSRQQASNRRREPTPKAPKTESLFEVGQPADMATQVVDEFTKKLDQLMTASFTPNATHISTQPEPCSFCSSTMHQVNNCPTTVNYTNVSNEKVNVAFSRPGNDPYSNTYNQGWRNHPNFSWKSPNVENSAQGPHNQAQSNRQPYNSSSTYQPPQKQYQAAPPPRSNLNFEDWMLKMMSDMSDRMVGEVNGRVSEITHIVGEMNGMIGEMSQTVNSHSQSIAKLETQVE
jgi:hypothetical protein